MIREKMIVLVAVFISFILMPALALNDVISFSLGFNVSILSFLFFSVVIAFRRQKKKMKGVGKIISKSRF